VSVRSGGSGAGPRPHSTIVLLRISTRLCGLFNAATLAADLGLGTQATGPEWTGDSGSTGRTGDAGSTGVKGDSGSSWLTDGSDSSWLTDGSGSSWLTDGSGSSWLTDGSGSSWLTESRTKRLLNSFYPQTIRLLNN
jgi:hypothetical protein